MNPYVIVNSRSSWNVFCFRISGFIPRQVSLFEFSTFLFLFFFFLIWISWHVYIYIYVSWDSYQKKEEKKEESRKLEEGNLARYKTRNPETENVPRRTAINNDVRVHKAEIMCFCRLDNGSLTGFILKPIVADYYDIEYFIFTLSWRYVILREFASLRSNRVSVDLIGDKVSVDTNRELHSPQIT